jgi:tetratricopeptide (TPR) repeat protein
MRKTIGYIFVFLISLQTGAYNSDSLYSEILKKPDDLTKLKYYNLLEGTCAEQDILKYSMMTLAFADKLLRLQPRQKDSILYLKGVAYNDLAYYYQENGKSSKAVEFLSKAIQMQEELRDSVALVVNLVNMGQILKTLGDTARSFSYYKRAEKIAILKNNIRLLPNIQSRLGEYYTNKKNYDTSLIYCNKALTIAKATKRPELEISILVQMGVAYHNQLKTSQALSFYEEALHLSEVHHTDKELSSIYLDMGMIYHYQVKNKKKALELLQRGLSIAEKQGSAKKRYEIILEMAYCYAALGDFTHAYLFHRRHLMLKDSFQTSFERKQAYKKNLQYEFERKFTADSIKNQAEQKIMDAQLRSQKKELQQEKTIKYTLILVAVLILFLAYFIFNRLRHSREQNRIISEQKHQVEEQKELIEKQKEVVEDKQKEILDSIRYAKRIQQSLLPTGKYMEKHLKK